MSLEKLLEKIRDDAEKKSAEIILAAEKKAQEILSLAKAKKEAAKKKIIEQESARIKQESKGKEALLQIEGRKKLLARKQEILGTVYQKAAVELASLSPPFYQDFIEKKLVQLVEKGEYKIIIAANDQEKITENFIKKVNQKLGDQGVSLKLESFSPGIEHGFILKQGKIEINASLQEMIKAEKENLDLKLSKLLFE